MVKYLIVGSGFTAATLCFHLLKAGIQPNAINIVGPTKLGYGNACLLYTSDAADE